MDEKKSRKRQTLTEEELDDIGNLLVASPKSRNVFWLLSMEWQKNSSGWHSFLKFRSSKTTAVFSRLPPGCEAKIQCCRWLQELVFNGLLDPELTFYSY
jgi:hypothetical protein